MNFPSMNSKNTNSYACLCLKLCVQERMQQIERGAGWLLGRKYLQANLRKDEFLEFKVIFSEEMKKMIEY